MTVRQKKQKVLLAIIGVLLLVLSQSCAKAPTRPEGAVSEFGRYEKYSEPVYDTWVRQSQYVTMRDGVKLAVDIVRPSVEGRAVETPLPLVWTHDRYHRAHLHEGKLYSEVDQSSGLQMLVKRGYIVAAVDVRGGGASFGRYLGTFSPEESRDAYELTEWFAAQPWCDGNIGMYGGSYLGITQLMAAGQAPPHLKAIFPRVAAFDLFSFIRDGGIYRKGFIDLWGNLTRQLDTETPPVPVDEDVDGEMLKAAVAQHADNWDVMEESAGAVFRDGEDYASLWQNTPSAIIDRINASGVAVYISGGWYDLWPRDAFQMYANFTVPTRVLIGPWPHGSWNDAVGDERSRVVNTEQLRWFDYWLKGIENGILDEPPIHFAVNRTPGESWTWKSADSWPLRDAELVPFYLGPGPGNSADSANDGSLILESPDGDQSFDEYTVDYSTTSGEETRWHCGVGVTMNYPDMSTNDAKALTYTSDVLEEDLTVIGHPVVTLYVSSSADDGDFFAYLEEVDAEGVSHYISEGQLRASCRALGDPPYANLGLPFHPVSKDGIRRLNPDEVVELTFDLHPVANIFDKGHRIRIAVTCADAGMAETEKISPAPLVRIFRSRDRPSHILLPLAR
jgi:putative CocE/NonD family hydrolase